MVPHAERQRNGRQPTSERMLGQVGSGSGSSQRADPVGQPEAKPAGGGGQGRAQGQGRARALTPAARTRPGRPHMCRRAHHGMCVCQQSHNLAPFTPPCTHR